MSPTPTRRRGFAALVGVAILLVIYTHTTGLSFAPISFSMTSSPDQHRPEIGVLPVPSTTYVISLPHRTDRYEDMERLRSLLGVQWNYIVAENYQSPLVERIMSGVRSLREEKMKGYPTNTTVQLPFEWPSPDTAFTTPPFQGSSDTPASPAASNSDPLTTAQKNFTLTPYSKKLPEHMILTRGRIACWHSHLSVIQRVATHAPDDVALILEDDVDMESDIKERLAGLWNLLPADWDMVFLGESYYRIACDGDTQPSFFSGHCWGRESTNPPLGKTWTWSPELNASVSTALHPSHTPLCTHAYALSPAGAKRLLRDLNYPPFAYSRAIDSALAFLVFSRRVKSFSLVPSIVVQRKIGNSDVVAGKGSWKDKLVHGMLANEGY
ncbi:hypothetical protein MVEN_00964100 [Mycena venus]|uniref:Glycosyl transferase family 25 domain-containing protein n=1 Tax=Mycena venus TaxID=2733690 RepID=A0A8H6YAS6_9AGAR|nr:hypothetical protein MVEN_00964100 [Mycena venus]